MRFQVDGKEKGKRVDIAVLGFLNKGKKQDISRSFLRKYWDILILVNGEDVKPSLKLKEGDDVVLNEDKLQEIIQKDILASEIEGQEGEIEIEYEDENCIVLNKKSGVVVHPGSGNTDKTLANFVVHYLQQKGEYDNKVKRGGVVHRLDKSVSGLILFAKTLEAQKVFQKQFQDHKVVKVYYAKIDRKDSKETGEKLSVLKELENLEKNNFTPDSSWKKLEGYMCRSRSNRMKMQFTLGGRSPNCKYTLSYIKHISNDELLIKIETGRMHQIRASLEYEKMHIVGDTLYSSVSGNGGVPDSIELKSILLSLKNLDGKRMTFRLEENEQKKKK